MVFLGGACVAIEEPPPDTGRQPDVAPTASSSRSARDSRVTSNQCSTPTAGTGASGSAGRLSPPPNVTEPRPFAPLPLIEDARLSQRLKSIIGAGKSTAVVVKDLNTGRGATLNAGRSYYAASLFKLFVMYEIFHQRSLGLVQDAQKLTLTPYYESFGLTLRKTRVCQQLTVAQALEAMMSLSDNAAAVMLQDLAGSANINRSLQTLGLKSTGLLEDDLPATAADIALLLEGIGRRLLVSRTASDEMLQLMASEELDNGLQAGLPAGARLAHKTGNWGRVTHDAGIVLGPGMAYVVVVLSDAADAPAVTKAISSAAYDFFKSR